ncbi:hypothetical protein D0N36_18880 [Hymenobacter lapidiphilus]|uniref:hypothetical protein n=1 Tax=Hymenobacter sp. CCM 8763 TaxID=2303334 RepID=UPI000E355B53|nr:hypothetical protein [Hymenobacter sp. CCM 8763]RFP63544.1 hypothetical protein D0N36_18880 [Hymenobacter sp. CCM 8763]
MKLFVSLLLLAGFAALTTPAHAQQATTARPVTDGGVKPTTNQQARIAQATPAREANDAKLTWQQRRAIKRKKLTPYAEAMLHNELLREEPTKKTGTSLF